MKHKNIKKLVNERIKKDDSDLEMNLLSHLKDLTEEVVKNNIERKKRSTRILLLFYAFLCSLFGGVHWLITIFSTKTLNTFFVGIIGSAIFILIALKFIELSGVLEHLKKLLKKYN